jgi:hypothetical protein
MGFEAPIDEDRVLAEFGTEQSAALEEAIAELASERCITAQDLIGLKLPRMQCQLELFAIFDSYVSGHDPTADAAHLAEMVLATGEAIDIPALHTETGWDLRRFNPALAIVGGHVDPGRVLAGYDGRYPIRHFALLAADRVELKRLIQRSRQT